MLSIHSHPGISPATEDEVYSMTNDYSLIKDLPSSKAQKYYIYFPISKHVYSLTHKGYSYLGKSINAILKTK